MITPSLAAGLAQLQALANFIDEGSANATFVFYNDTKPANVDLAANNSAQIVTLSLPKPCFKRLKTSSIELYPTEVGTILKTGTVTWARLFNGNGITVMDFDCSTDMNLDTRDLILGASFDLDSIEFLPAT